MSTLEKRFRRNFVVACVVHALLIGGIVLFEGIINNAHSNASLPVELITPADILGDLPKGEGQGRGAYTAPPPETKNEAIAAPAAPAAPTVPPAAPTPVEPVAPKVKAPPPEVKNPDDIAISKKTTSKEVKKTTDATAKKTVASAKSTTNTVKTVVSTKSAANGVSGTAESAASIRQRFASALASAEGGTAGGNNRPAGGGTGESKYGRLGSPDGSPDGIAGGVGKGSPFWSYYMQVHDRMYEAWEQPGQAVSYDKKLVTTLVLHVARNGRIEGVSLQHSSGNKLMDDSAVAAAHSVPRLDPLPEGLGGDFADISVNFRLEG